jgi:uncharacterized protein with von Willebrand factor type A (vWA) domain
LDRNDLLKMLDLGGKDTTPEEARDVAITPNEQPTQASAASPTVLRLDGWGLRKGEELLALSERLKALKTDTHEAADFHGAAFLPDQELHENCVDPRRHEFLKQLLETPDYAALHESTMLHPAASEIAACAFAEQFAQLKHDQEKQPDKDAMDREMDTLRAVGKALAKATEEVGEMSEAVAALGLGPGSPGSNDPRAIASLFRRVRNNAVLRRICALAGRYRRVAQSRQRQKVSHGLDDMVGVVLDGDIGRLLPHELGKLLIPEFELDTPRRLIERQAMCREYRATEPAGKGPILVVVDESGSMEGEKVETAKALALALAWVARQQRRWAGLIAYSGESGERLLALPPGRWNDEALASWLEAFIGRGSNLDVPVAELPDFYRRIGAPVGKTDVIVITDALLRIPPSLIEPFLSWKKAVQARVLSLVIQSEPGQLPLISDEVHSVRSLSADEDAVGRALSV